jgi:hypothetical protein
MIVVSSCRRSLSHLRLEPSLDICVERLGAIDDGQDTRGKREVGGQGDVGAKELQNEEIPGDAIEFGIA